MQHGVAGRRVCSNATPGSQCPWSTVEFQSSIESFNVISFANGPDHEAGASSTASIGIEGYYPTDGVSLGFLDPLTGYRSSLATVSRVEDDTATMAGNLFADKTVLITGGTSGIGRAAAELFARSGAHVVIAGRRAELGEQVTGAIRADGGRCTFVQTDVSSAEEVAALVAAVVREHGRLDCAFNNAATSSGLGKRLADFTPDEWDDAMASNLRGLWLCLRAEIRQMLAQEPGGGAIVNTSSVNGLGAAPRGGPYSVAKAGVLALSKGAAIEYAGDGIRVNALVAGAFDTPMLRGAMKTVAEQSGQSIDAVRARYESEAPLNRIGDPVEAAQAALWLCSDQASYVTGHSMIVDGGMTCFDR